MNLFKGSQTNWQYVLIIIALCFLIAKAYSNYTQSVSAGMNSIVNSIETRRLGIIKVDWKTHMDENYRYEISYPFSWALEKDCYKNVGDVDCIKSSDFKGYLGASSNDIQSGAAILISCEKGIESLTTAAILQDCLWDKKIYPEKKTCKLVKLGNTDSVNLENGIYKLINTNIQYSLTILDPHEKNTDDIALITKSFKVF